MSEKFGKDLTVGSIPRHLLTFSIPMLIGNLIQVGYGIVNTIWVGNIVGKDGVGATTVSFQIIFILMAVAAGATIATTIMVSQYYGAKDYNMVEKVVNNSFSVTLILGTVLTIVGIAVSDSILRLMNTPPEVFQIASNYLKITLAGFIPMYLGMLITSILRGIGDTMTPLAFMSIGIGLNAVLDPFLIIGIWPFPRLGLDGAAIASLIAQIVALIIGLVYLNRKGHMLAMDPKKFLLDKHITLMIFKIGFPSIIQQSLISIGSAVIITFVNAFGSAAIDAYGAATRIDNIAFMPAMSLSMAASALTGQNLGAQKPERVKDIFKWGIIMTSVITVAISLLAVSIPRLLLSMFGLSGDVEVMNIGVAYLRIVGATYILFAIMFISNGIINGAGHTMITMFFSLFSIWIIRVSLAFVLSKYTKLGLTGIWIAIITSFAVVMTISLIYYFSGRWKKAVIKTGKPILQEK